MAKTELRREETIEGRLLLGAANWLTLLLLSAGVIFPCLSAYGISDRHGFDLGAVLAFCVFGSLAASAVFAWRRWIWIALALAAGDGLILWRLWKRVTEKWLLGRPPALFDLTGKYPGALFLLYALVILLLGWIVVRARAWWLAAALVTLPLLPAIQSGVLPAWGGMLAGFAGWGSMLLTALFGRRDADSLGRARFLSLAGMAALVMALVMCLPREGYVRPQWATDARTSLIRGVTRQMERFFDLDAMEGGLLADLGLDFSIPGEEAGSGPGQGDGPGVTDPAAGGRSGEREDLLSAGPRRYLGRRVMTVRTDRTDPAGRIYLRGTSFDTYTGTSWEHSGALADFAEVEQFPALTAPEAAEYTMYVRYTAFNSLLYYPYRFTGSGEMDGAGRITGLNDGSGNFLSMEEIIDPRQNEYSVTYRPGGPQDGFTSLDGGRTAEEESYRYGNDAFWSYLYLPGDLGYILSPLTEEIRRETVSVDPRLPEQFQEPVAAAARTASYLASIASYDTSTPAMEEGEDFVTHFLAEQRGYCVHFATAGAMLLRAQGIPARYVGGYVVDLDSRGRASVLDSDAHAWVEIYLDGYGWYPVEMTPGYTGGETGVELADAPDEEIPDETDTPVPDEIPEEEVPDPIAPEDLGEEDLPGEEAEEAGTETAASRHISGRAALVLAALCILYALSFLPRYLERKDPDTNRSALRAYRRYQRVLSLGGVEDETLEELGRKAKFSQHTLTEEERTAAWSHLEAAAERARARQKKLVRWLFPLLRPIL